MFPITIINRRSSQRHLATLLTCALIATFVGCAAIVCRADPAPSDPLGATVHADGTTFRLWAPFVSGVAVESPGKTPLALDSEPGLSPDSLIWSGKAGGIKAGDRYRFAIAINGQSHSFVDPRAQEIVGQGVDAWGIVPAPSPPMPAFTEPSFNRMVIYELHVGTFHASSVTHRYDFKGAAEQLGYLQKLGVNAVELMPIIPNPSSCSRDPNGFDWGYDVVHPYAVNPSYGTPDDFRAFVAACHRASIAVIVDVVYNHFAGANLLKDFGGFTSPDLFDGVYFYGGDRNSTGFGPRPDFGRPQVRQYVIDNSLLLLRDFDVDGLRWDSVVNIRAFHYDPDHQANPEGQQMMRDANDAYRATFPGKISIAEDLRGAWEVTNPTDQGGLGFNSQWDEDLWQALRNAVIPVCDDNRDLTKVANGLRANFGGDVFKRVIYTENHDKVGHPNDIADWHPQIRLPMLINGADPEGRNAKKLSTLAATVLLTAPGIPMLFQGQEMLDGKQFDFNHASTVDWNRTKKMAGIVALYHDLIAVRENRALQTAGLTEQKVNVFHIDPADHTLAYHRFGNGGPGDDVVVIANFSGKRIDALKIGLPRDGVWHVRFNSGDAKYDRSFTQGSTADVTASAGDLDGLNFVGTVAVGPYSAVVLSQ